MSQTAIEELISDWTIADLAARTGRSVGEIVEFAMRARRANARAQAAPAAKTAAAPKKAGRPAKRGKAVDTRTAAGREAYQEAVGNVVEAKGGKPTSAAEIRAKVGGTPTQARAALARLIEDGKITYEGKARATRYLAV